MKKIRWFILVVFSIFAVFSCRPSRTILMPTAGYAETGLASWYGPEFHGKKTSSSEIFDMHDLTAAHRTLPFGTMVLVTNLENSQTVTVKINDRGPFVKDRIIDLSYAAARMLGMIGPGTAKVKIEVVGYASTEELSQTGDYILQLGSFINPGNAKKLYLNLKKEFPHVYLSPYQTKTQVYYRVRLRVKTQAEARKLAEKLSFSGYPVLVLKE
jgi:rare lipoprotein A